MRTMIAVMLLAALCGCGPKKSAEKSAEVVALEKRIASLEQKWKEQGELLLEKCTNDMASNEELQALLHRSAQASAKVNDSFLAWMSAEPARVRVAIAQVLEERAGAFRANSRPAPAAPVVAARPAPGAFRAGVPVAVYDRIAAEAAKVFPGSFDGQEVIIKNEIEAYRRLHP